MQSMKSFMRFAVRALAGLLASAWLAPADTIVVTGVDWNRGESIQVGEDGADKQTYFAGVVLLSVYADGRQYARDTLCVDLFTEIYIGNTYDTTVLSPSQVPGKNLEQVSWLVDNTLLPTQDTTYLSDLPASDWIESAVQGAGVQLAIWDLVHDGGDLFSAGRVQAAADPSHPTDPAVLDWAEKYESLSAGQGSDLAYIYRNVDEGSGQLVQMLAGPRFHDGGPSPAPEPSTLALVGAALIVVGCLGRRKPRRRPGAWS
jgi:hypothetical protein